jgi:hypothetical protein
LPTKQPEPYTAPAILGAAVQSNRFIKRHASQYLRFEFGAAFDKRYLLAIGISGGRTFQTRIV